MTQSEILLAAIRADPADNLARLAYADALEEKQGACPRSELIRVQMRQHEIGEPERNQCVKCTRRIKCEWHALEERACDLIAGQVMPPLRFPIEENAKSYTWIHHVTNADAIYAAPGARIVWRRGFPHLARVPMAAWERYARELAQYPLERVEITDKSSRVRVPISDSGVLRRSTSGISVDPTRDFSTWLHETCYVWADHARDPQLKGCSISTDVWDALPGVPESRMPAWKRFASEEAANDALSAALILTARKG